MLGEQPSHVQNGLVFPGIEFLVSHLSQFLALSCCVQPTKGHNTSKHANTHTHTEMAPLPGTGCLQLPVPLQSFHRTLAGAPWSQGM